MEGQRSSVNASPQRPRQEYELHLRGHLDESWRESFPGLTFTHRVDAEGMPLTIFRGPVTDEAELHGLLARIRDLGVPLLLVRRATPAEPAARPEPFEPNGGEYLGSH
jgi:hypothetical protein